jgi:hypothetical protein
VAITARDFITMAMKEAGVLGIGQSPNSEDINDAFTILHRMLAIWQKKRWIVPSLYDIAMPGNGKVSNLIGPGQYWNAKRPDKIQAAYFIQNAGLSNPPNPVSFRLRPIWSYEDYAKVTLKEMTSWPTRFFYDNAFPYGNVFIWPIPDASYTIHLILKSPIGFTVELSNGVITNQGAVYANGVYVAIPFLALTGFGTGGTADVTVAGNKVTAIAIHDPGDGYNINDTLTLDTTLMGGVGNGFVWTVTGVTDDLDAIFNMPSEYEEAIHYNLCVRLCSMYQYPVNPVQAGLAKLALNTIKVSNAQIPSLEMPSSLRSRSGGNWPYIFNIDAQ